MSITPLNRWEQFMAKIAGQSVDIQPLNRTEEFYNEIAKKTTNAPTFDIDEPSDGDTLVYDADSGKWENGSGGGGGDGALVVGVTWNNDDSADLDKTWQEIYDAAHAGYPIVVKEDYGAEGIFYNYIVGSVLTEGLIVTIHNLASGNVEITFEAASASGYPHSAGSQI